MKWTNLNLSALQYFVDTIELGSLTKAALKNHVTRPAISQAIRRIEDVIGHELIDHSKNRLVLTDEGKHFYTKSKASLDLFTKAISSEKKNAKNIRLATTASLAEFLLAPIFKKFHSQFSPNIQVQIGTTARVNQLVLDGEVNLGFIINNGLTVGVESVVIGKGNFILYSKTGKFLNPLITTETRPEVMHLFKIFKKVKQEIDQHMQIESWSIVHKMHETLGGTCLLPDLIPVHSKKIFQDVKYEYTYNIMAIYKDINLLSEAEVALIKMLKQSQK